MDFGLICLWLTFRSDGKLMLKRKKERKETFCTPAGGILYLKPTQITVCHFEGCHSGKVTFKLMALQFWVKWLLPTNHGAEWLGWLLQASHRFACQVGRCKVSTGHATSGIFWKWKCQKANEMTVRVTWLFQANQIKRFTCPPPPLKKVAKFRHACIKCRILSEVTSSICYSTWI